MIMLKWTNTGAFALLESKNRLGVATARGQHGRWRCRSSVFSCAASPEQATLVIEGDEFLIFMLPLAMLQKDSVAVLRASIAC